MKGGTRWLETWTYLKEKLWSHSWEESQGLWSPTTEAGELWGERLKVCLDFFNRFRNVTFRPLASLAWLKEATQGGPSSPTSDPCSSASLKCPGPPCPSVTGTWELFPSLLKFPGSQGGDRKGSWTQLNEYMSKSHMSHNQHPKRKIFVPACCQPSVFHHNNIQLFLF